MTWDGIYRREPIGDQPVESEQVRQVQAKALGAFGSYARPLGVVVNGRYDGPTSAFIEEYQARKQTSGYQPTLPANKAAKRGDLDYATKVALGLIAGTIVTGPVPPSAVAYSVAGTWAGWNDGPPAWTCWLLNAKRFYQQGVGYPAMGFLQPDPNVSYNESRDAGVAELLNLALPDPRPKVPIGYSQGADVVTRFLHAWPAERRNEIRLVVKFGDPGKLPGTDATGSTSANGGISRVFTPEWCTDRTLSYQIKGDMYGDAPGLLPFLYDILTRLEASGEFLFYMFGLLTGIPIGGASGGLGNLGGLLGGLGNLGGLNLGGGALLPGLPTSIGGLNLGGGALLPGLPLGSQPQAPPNLLGAQLLGVGSSGAGLPGFGSLSGLLGLVTPGPITSVSGPISLAAMLFNLPAIIQTLVAALQFVMTNAHSLYGGTGSAQVFNGTDAVIDASRRINALQIAA
jgi:hypothetical protein